MTGSNNGVAGWWHVYNDAELINKRHRTLARLDALIFIPVVGVWFVFYLFGQFFLSPKEVELVSLGFDFFFTFELLVKLFMLRSYYFWSVWFVIDLASVLPFLTTAVKELRAFKAFKEFKMMRIVRGLKFLREISRIIYKTHKYVRVNAADERNLLWWLAGMVSMVFLAIILSFTTRASYNTRTLQLVDFVEGHTLSEIKAHPMYLGMSDDNKPGAINVRYEPYKKWVNFDEREVEESNKLLNLVVIVFLTIIVSGLLMTNTIHIGQTTGEGFERITHPFIGSEVMEMLANVWREGGEQSLIKHAQNRVCTMMFTDIKGFSAFAEGMDPIELLHGNLRPYFTIIERVVKKYGGTPLSHIGDALVAVFNAPNDLPDHEMRACLAAVEIQAALAKAREEGALYAFETRIGVNTGGVVAGAAGSDFKLEYTMIGDAVNIASRLEVLNNMVGSLILIGDDTYEGAGDRIVTRFIGRVVMKGRREPLHVYHVLGTKDMTDDLLLQFKEAYEKGIALFINKEFDEYAACLEEANTLWRKFLISSKQKEFDDPMCLYFLARRGEMATAKAAGALGEDFDVIEQMTK